MKLTLMEGDISEKTKDKYYKYGRWWYKTRSQADDEANPKETVCYESGMKRYYIIKPCKKTFWSRF